LTREVPENSFRPPQNPRIGSISRGLAFPSGVQESDEAGLTLVASERVAVARILESPVSIECILE